MCQLHIRDTRTFLTETVPRIIRSMPKGVLFVLFFNHDDSSGKQTSFFRQGSGRKGCWLCCSSAGGQIRIQIAAPQSATLLGVYRCLKLKPWGLSAREVAIFLLPAHMTRSAVAKVVVAHDTTLVPPCGHSPEPGTGSPGSLLGSL